MARCCPLPRSTRRLRPDARLVAPPLHPSPAGPAARGARRVSGPPPCEPASTGARPRRRSSPPRDAVRRVDRRTGDPPRRLPGERTRWPRSTPAWGSSPSAHHGHPVRAGFSVDALRRLVLTPWKFPTRLPSRSKPSSGTPGAMATISDIAAKAGVGIGTVSRVLNGSHQVRPTTRARVQAAMEELDYHPTRSGTGRAGRHQRFVGVLVPHFDEPSTYQRLRGIVRALQPHGLEVVLYNVDAPDRAPSALGGSSTASARWADHRLAAVAIGRGRQAR